MVTKAKTTSSASKETTPKSPFEGDFFNAASFQENFDKAMTSYGEFTKFNKETIDAFVKSATVAGKGVEAVNTEIAGFSKRTFDDSAAIAKDAFSAKSAQELLEIQADFSKTFLNSVMGQFTKVTEMIGETTREASEPLNERFTAAVDAAQSSVRG